MNEITLNIKIRKINFFIFKLKIYFLFVFKKKRVDNFIEDELKNNLYKYIKGQRV